MRTSRLPNLASLALILLVSRADAGLRAYYSFDSDYSLTGGTYCGTLSETEIGGATVAITSTTGEYKFGAVRRTSPAQPATRPT